MGLFDDIGRAFQDFGNQVNNEVIQPAQITLDPSKNGTVDFFDPNKGKFNSAFNPNKNGVSDAFNPNKNGFINEVSKIQDVPKIIEDLPNKIETQINVELKKINPRLKLPPKPKIPPPRVLKPTEINDIIKKGFEDTISKPFEKDIIKPFEKDIVKPLQTGFQKDIIDGFQTKIIDGFQKDIIDGFQRDIISPSKTLFDTIGDGLKQGGSTKSSNNDSGSSYDLIIYAGLGLLAAYIIIK